MHKKHTSPLFPTAGCMHASGVESARHALKSATAPLAHHCHHPACSSCVPCQCIMICACCAVIATCLSSQLPHLSYTVKTSVRQLRQHTIHRMTQAFCHHAGTWLSNCHDRSQDVKQMQKDQLAMQQQLRTAEHRSAAVDKRLTFQQRQRQQLVAACEPILAWVCACINALSLFFRV